MHLCRKKIVRKLSETADHDQQTVTFLFIVGRLEQPRAQGSKSYPAQSGQSESTFGLKWQRGLDQGDGHVGSRTRYANLPGTTPAGAEISRKATLLESVTSVRL